MGYRDFFDDLLKDDLKSLYVFYGEEEYMKKLMLTKAKQKIINAEIDLYETKDKNPNYDEIYSAVSMFPFASDKRLIIVHNSEFFFSAKCTKAKLDKFLEAHSNNNSVVTILLAKSIDKRKTAYKTLSKGAKFVDFMRLEPAELKSFVVKKITEAGYKIKEDALRYFIENSEYLISDSEMKLFEVEKTLEVITSSVEDKIIDRQTVALYVDKSVENNVFKWREAVVLGNTKSAFIYLDKLILAKEPPIKLIYMVNQLLSDLLNIKFLMKKNLGASEIARIMKSRDFIVKNNIAILRKIPEDKLLKMFKLSLDADDMMKMGGVDGLTVLQKLICQISI